MELGTGKKNEVQYSRALSRRALVFILHSKLLSPAGGVNVGMAIRYFWKTARLSAIVVAVFYHIVLRTLAKESGFWQLVGMTR